MSTRRVVSAKAAGNAVRHKPSLVNTNFRGQVIKPKSDRNEDEGNSMTWWKETAGQLSPILRYIKLGERLSHFSSLYSLSNPCCTLLFL